MEDFMKHVTDVKIKENHKVVVHLFQCECGEWYTKKNKHAHELTDKHINWIVKDLCNKFQQDLKEMTERGENEVVERMLQGEALGKNARGKMA